MLSCGLSTYAQRKYFTKFILAFLDSPLKYAKLAPCKNYLLFGTQTTALPVSAHIKYNGFVQLKYHTDNFIKKSSKFFSFYTLLHNFDNLHSRQYNFLHPCAPFMKKWTLKIQEQLTSNTTKQQKSFNSQFKLLNI